MENESVVEEQYIISNEVYTEIAEVLEAHGAVVSQIDARGNLYQQFENSSADTDLVFNLAQDLYQVGVPMVLDQLKLEKKKGAFEYTGARFEGHTLALNKKLARNVLGEKVTQPEWWFLESEQTPLPDAIEFPVIVKPVNEAHSIGIRQSNVVYSVSELEQVLERLRARVGGGMLIESFLDGNEYSMGIVGNVIFPAAAWDLDEIPGKPLVRGEDLKQKDLTVPHASFVRAPDLSLELATQVATTHMELGLLDYSRSDFRARKSSAAPYFLEVNSGCGLRNHQSLLPWTAAGAGVSYTELIASIAAQALYRLPEAHLDELDIEKFDATYAGLQEKAKSQRSF
ncbi:MAG: hypothetical protein AAF570_20770, partial [Bacteroidota bacterium]